MRARRFLVVPAVLGVRCAAARSAKRRSERREEALIKIVPQSRRQVYKMRTIVEAVFDKGSFFEIGRAHGRSSITGLARLDGWPVAVLASDPFVYGGAWTAKSSMKVMRFVDLPDVSSAGRAPRRHSGVPHRARSRAGGHHPARRAGDDGDLSGDGAVVHDFDPQSVRGRGGCDEQRDASAVPLCVAVGRLGLVAARGWDRGGLPARPRGGGRSGEIARGDRREAQSRALAVSDGGKIRDRGDHRSPRYAKILCAFANLAAPLRAPGMRATAYRP